MSGYRGRTGPNFSEYLNTLNSMPPSYEPEQFAVEDLELNHDLAMFTNTDFTNIDIPSIPEDGAFNFDLNNNKMEGNFKYEDLLSGNDSVQNFQNNTDNSPVEASQFYSTYNTPIQPATGFNANDSHASPNSAQINANLSRRKAEPSPSQAISPEEKSRLAAEEDKRRRNTAASARFRVKKKQREQALEKTVKEVSDKNSKLEAKINQLEMENKWLKELITEKNGIQSKEEMAAAYQKYRKESEERDLNSIEHTTGVGTD